MPRDLSAGMIAALNSVHVRFVYFVEIETAASPSMVRVWSGSGSIIWDSKTWLGMGKFGTISSIGETSAVRAEGVKASLSGIPAELVTVALDASRPGLDAKIWIGLIADSGSPPVETILPDPFLSFSGKTDAVSILESGETATIEIAVENKLIALHRASQRRYTHEDQQHEFPGDRGFEYVEKIQELNLPVGRSAAPPFRSDAPVSEPISSVAED